MDLHVTIKTNTVDGRKIAKEIAKHPQGIESSIPVPTNQKTYTIDEVYHHGMKKLSEHYGVDMYEIAKNTKQ